jgi:hypothetical protein
MVNPIMSIVLNFSSERAFKPLKIPENMLEDGMTPL